jgi:hypothetical protein
MAIWAFASQMCCASRVLAFIILLMIGGVECNIMTLCSFLVTHEFSNKLSTSENTSLVPKKALSLRAQIDKTGRPITGSKPVLN